MTAHGGPSLPSRTGCGVGRRSHPALSQLRSATAALHRQLDDALALTSSGLDHLRYGQVLLDIYEVVAPLEDAIGDVGLPLEDWRRRRRAALLARDLADLVVHVRDDPSPDGIHGWAAAQLTPDAALGATYVLEGSLLGGRVVSAAVRQALGCGAPTRWFRPGGDVAERWLTFCGAVGDRADAGGDVDAMVGGATSTFEAFLARVRA